MLAWSVALAVATASPSTAQVLTEEEAAFFVRRVGLSARPDEIVPYVGLTRAAAIDKAIAGMTTTAVTPLPDAATSLLSFPKPDARDDSAVVADTADIAGVDVANLKAAGKALLGRLGQKGLSLKAWWIEELCATTSPLTERVTLALHDHFTSSLKKVRDPRLMARQNALLRQHAGGSYRALVYAIVDDAAMLRYLDADSAVPDGP